MKLATILCHHRWLYAIAVLGLNACSAQLPQNSIVEQAYNESGVITVPPYTRTIFSSTNF